MRSIFKTFIILILFTGLLFSCKDKRNPNYQYMANKDMYSSLGYETYSKNPVFKDSISAQKPANGSIARGKIPYDYPDSVEGYEFAKKNLISPLEKNEENLAQGKYLYDIYCATCHGIKGDGQGVLSQREKFLGIPNYKDRQITEGSIYHVIMYGRNLMGSHASQLRENERWQIVQYVEKLKSELQ
ncbi:MAG: cytochrome c [Flavobacteriaceae bacterium]|nr:cytochrome c [Flavobacteriaceae bacterium]